MTPEQLTLRQEWIAALKSGQYKQAHQTLKEDDQTYCCLGVLCTLTPALGEFVDIRPLRDQHEEDVTQYTSDELEELIRFTDTKYAFDSKTGWDHTLPPESMQTLIGMTENQFDLLARINDNGYTFDAIAFLLEHWEEARVKGDYDYFETIRVIQWLDEHGFPVTLQAKDRGYDPYEHWNKIELQARAVTPPTSVSL